MRIFSGIQPTGTIHIGNYLGALKNWVELQKDFDCIYSIVDLHAISAPYDAKEFPRSVLNTAAILLAIGIDPQKFTSPTGGSTLFIQSQRPEVTQLAWIFNTLSNMGELTRMTQYKEKTAQFKDQANVGLFTYPLLQAADILLYKAQRVPVGEDQLQHVELARVLARRFNNRFGDVFPKPEPIVTKGARIMALNNPAKKMSKSLPGSYISLTDTPDEIRSKIRRAVTDSGPTSIQEDAVRRSAPNKTRMNNSSEISRAKADAGPNNRNKTMAPAIANLFTLLNAFAKPEIVNHFTKAYDDATIRYTELKDALAEAVVGALNPIQKRYQDILAKPDELNKILSQGAEALRPIAESTLKEVKQKMGLNQD